MFLGANIFILLTKIAFYHLIKTINTPKKDVSSLVILFARVGIITFNFGTLSYFNEYFSLVKTYYVIGLNGF